MKKVCKKERKEKNGKEKKKDRETLSKTLVPMNLTRKLVQFID